MHVYARKKGASERGCEEGYNHDADTWVLQPGWSHTVTYGCRWVNDAAVGGHSPPDVAFYRELRDRLGLARWECGRLSDE